MSGMRMSSRTRSGARRAAVSNRLATVAGLAGNVHISTFAQQRGQAFARERLVIDDQDFGVHPTSVPFRSGNRTVHGEIVGRRCDALERAVPAEMVLDTRARVCQRHAVTAGGARSGRRARIADHDFDGTVHAAPVDRHRAALGQLLDAVIHRILDQRLQQQRRHRQVRGQVGDVQFHMQALAQTQLFDIQIAPHQVQFLAQRAACGVVTQCRTEQIGQVLDCALGVLRPQRDKARDRVHAVEQEMWPDARLQRLEARLGLGAHARAPLFQHIEIAQQRRTDQRAQRRAAPDEASLKLRRQGQAEIELLIDTEDQRAADDGHQQHQRIRRQHAQPRRQLFQLRTQLAQADRADQRQPLHEHTRRRQPRQQRPRLVARRDQNHQRQQFGNDHHRKQHRQTAKIRQPVRQRGCLLDGWRRGRRGVHGAWLPSSDACRSSV